MPRALGARVLRRGAGPGVLPPSDLLLSAVCGGPSGSPPGGGVWGAWHAVGFWGGAPWCPGPLGLLLSFLGGSGVVGGLVVNCIVDASICGRPRYRELCCWSPVCLFFCLVRRAARAGVVRVARAPQWRGDRRGRARLARRGRVAVSRAALCRVLCCVLFVFMSVRWMPWHRGPMKDAVACDIPRGAGLRAVIRGFPNGGTRRPLWGVTRV